MPSKKKLRPLLPLLPQHPAGHVRRSHHSPLKSPHAASTPFDDVASQHPAALQIASEFRELTAKVDRETESGFSRADQEYDFAAADNIRQEIAHLSAGEQQVAVQLMRDMHDQEINLIKKSFDTTSRPRGVTKPNMP